MLGRVLNTPMNTTPKYSLNNYWWALESIEIKVCIGTKRVMPCLNIHVFISLSFLFDFWFFKQEDFFFQNFLSFELIGISIVKNKCCVILASTLNRVSVLFGNALSVSSNSHHQRRILKPVKHLWCSFLQK